MMLMLVCSGLMAQTFSATNLSVAIPDGSASGRSLRMTVTNEGTIARLTCRVRVAGQSNGDLYAYLRNMTPGRTNLVVLLNRTGRTAGNPWGRLDGGLDVVFDDRAAGDSHTATNLTGRLQPDGRMDDPSTITDTSPRVNRLGDFAGMPVAGEWTLFMADVDRGGTNAVTAWELDIEPAWQSSFLTNSPAGWRVSKSETLVPWVESTNQNPAMLFYRLAK
jgi:subtilisin-like proprotein convertase family protein